MVGFQFVLLLFAVHFAPAASRRVVADAGAHRTSCPGWCKMGPESGMSAADMCAISECKACSFLSCPQSGEEEETPSTPVVDEPRPIVPRKISRQCGKDSHPDAPAGKSIIYSDPGDGMVKTCAADGSNSRDLIGSVTPCPEVQKSFPSMVRNVASWSSRPTGIAVDKEANRIFFTDWMGGYDFNDEKNQAAFKEALGGFRKLLGGLVQVSGSQEAASATTSADSEGAIYSASLDDSKPMNEKEKNMIVFGMDKPWGIAADTVNKKIYWTEHGGKKVRRANYDGKNQEDVVTGLVQPRGIAVDAAAGKIYFADGLEASKIKRANLDGSNVEDIVWRTAHAQPEGLALHPTFRKVYWTERGTRRILRANLDGSDPEELLRFDTSHTPAGIFLDVEGEKMYWVDEEKHSLFKADLDGCNQVSVLTVDGWGAAPWGVIVL